MKKFTSKSQKIGELGEDLACKFLMKHEFIISERNYTRKWGEIDIIAEKDNKIIEEIVQAGEIMGIPVIDFIIISVNNHYSFYEKLKKQKGECDYVADGIQGTLFAKLECCRAPHSHWGRVRNIDGAFGVCHDNK